MNQHREISQDTPTAVEFNALLRELDARSECAGERYEALRWRLVRFFQCSFRLAAEDLVDITLNRVARRLASGGDTVYDVDSFIWGVARKVRTEAWRRDLKTVHLEDLPNQHAISDAGASTEALHRRLEKQQELKYLNHCLQSLPERDRELFLEYGLDRKHDRQNRERLARRFGLTPGALRIRVMRILKRVKKNVDRSVRTDFIPVGTGNICRKKNSNRPVRRRNLHGV